MRRPRSILKDLNLLELGAIFPVLFFSYLSITQKENELLVISKCHVCCYIETLKTACSCQIENLQRMSIS